MRFKKGDQVKVLAGKDRGKTGTIELINQSDNSALLKSVNLVKRHYKPQKNSAKRGIMEIPMPLAISNLGLICQNCQKVSRVSYKFIESKKYRWCKKCKEVLR